MPVQTFLANGSVVTPPAAPPPPPPDAAPPPPPPVVAAPTADQIAAADAAAQQVAAGTAALLAGGSAADVAAAEAAAGAPASTVATLAGLGGPASLPPPPGSAPLPPPPVLTQEQIDSINAAAAAAAAGAAAALAGGSAADIAAAEAAAGAPQSVIDAILATGIQGTGGVTVGGTGGTGGGVGGTDDLDISRRIANNNKPDLTNLPPFELDDPFALQFDAASNPPLKGGGALTAIVQACSDYGVDPFAAVANALHEGAGGTIGDGGLAYGPFQDHLTEFADRPFYGKGRNNETVNAWAWTENGIRYAVRAMVNGQPSAKGLRGHPAVYAIVYGFEKPGDEAGAYKTRVAEYDHLVALASGWAAYAAALLAGPTGGGAVDTTPIKGGTSSSYTPAGVTSSWRSLVDVFKLTVPAKRSEVDSLGKSLKGVFR